MPGAITHLKAAHIYIERVGGIDNAPQFYLGSVCPDSVNLNGHAPKEIRWPAHLRSGDLSVWESNAKRFYEENRNLYDSSYLLGYILHIITDIVWDREYDRPLCAMLHKSGVETENLKKMRWREIDGYELRQVGLDWHTEMMDNLKRAEALSIGTLNHNDISCWRTKIIEKDYNKDIVSSFVDDDFMDEFFNSVIENMLKIIEI